MLKGAGKFQKLLGTYLCEKILAKFDIDFGEE